jgi:hypothetical protein
VEEDIMITGISFLVLLIIAGVCFVIFCSGWVYRKVDDSRDVAGWGDDMDGMVSASTIHLQTMNDTDKGDRVMSSSSKLERELERETMSVGVNKVVTPRRPPRQPQQASKLKKSEDTMEAMV